MFPAGFGASGVRSSSRIWTLFEASAWRTSLLYVSLCHWLNFWCSWFLFGSSIRYFVPNIKGCRLVNSEPILRQVGKLWANTPVNSEPALLKPRDQFFDKCLFRSDVLMFSIDSCLMVLYCTCWVFLYSSLLLFGFQVLSSLHAWDPGVAHIYFS
jgi:hypothetical protein